MRRFSRALFNCITALSLALFLVTTFYWIRSFSISDYWRIQQDSTRNGKTHLFAATVLSEHGTVEASFESGWALSHWPDVSETYHSSGGAGVLIFQSLRGTGLERLGFRLSRQSWSSGFVHGYMASNGVTTIVDIPFWFLAIALGTLPLACGLRFARRRMRQREGYCRQCGYDLRATPGRCPECGVEVGSEVPGGH